jgi:hypothetical protein
MNLEKLISELEKANGLATKGEYFSQPGDNGMFNICGGGSIIAMKVFPKNAQAIAARHNTAALVLSELKAQRARADLAEALLVKANAHITDLAFHMDPYASSSKTCDVFDRAVQFLTEFPTPTEPAKLSTEKAVGHIEKLEQDAAKLGRLVPDSLLDRLRDTTLYNVVVDIKGSATSDYYKDPFRNIHSMSNPELREALAKLLDQAPDRNQR